MLRMRFAPQTPLPSAVAGLGWERLSSRERVVRRSEACPAGGGQVHKGATPRRGRVIIRRGGGGPFSVDTWHGINV